MYALKDLSRRQILEMALEGEIENERLAAKIEADRPKVEFCEEFQAAKGSVLIRQVAKMIGTGQDRLFNLLYGDKILLSHNEPYQEYVDKGYFSFRKGTHTEKDKKVAHTTELVTPKGQYWLWKRYHKALQNSA
jgi:phage antirepressor YoqD-like protein